MPHCRNGSIGFALFGLATLALAQGARAATPEPPARAPSVQGLLDCRAVSTDAARLACFDKAAAELDQATSRGDLITLDRAQRQAVRRQAFGFSLPSFTLFDRGERPEQVNRVTVKIASGGQDVTGKWVFHLDDGAVWRQIDDNELRRKLRPGAEAVISRGALGSYFMKVEGEQAIRVHRIG